jgi:hypothetical protein
MHSRTFGLTILAALFAATLLLPAANASARDNQALDPAIATAMRDHAQATATIGLDPAIATALRDRTPVTSRPVALDPAIATALLERASSPTRPDNRSGTRGVGSLPQNARETASIATDTNIPTIGAAVMLAALLLGSGSLIAIHHQRARVKNA